MKVSVIYSTLIVKNLDESVAFYKKAFGFTEGYHVELPVGRITIMNSQGGASVELIECSQFPAGLYSVGTDVDDLETAMQQVISAGGKIDGDIIKTTVGRQVFAIDPNGVRICMIEHSKEYIQKHMS